MLKYMMNIWIFLYSSLLYNFYAIKFILYEKYGMLYHMVKIQENKEECN